MNYQKAPCTSGWVRQSSRVALQTATLLALALPTLAGPRPPFFWYPGHALVAAMAYDRLDRPMQRRLVEILKAHPRYEEDFAAAMPEGLTSAEARDVWLLGAAANWPDLVKRFERGSALSAKYDRRLWHYITRPIFAGAADEEALRSAVPSKRHRSTEWTGTEPRADLNIVQAIKWADAVLRSEQAPRPDKAVALCWLLHLVGDAHQPLHAATWFSKSKFPDGDQGGNRIRVKGGGTLHSVWDGSVAPEPSMAVAARKPDWLTPARELRRRHSVAVRLATSLVVEDWIDESYALAVTAVYTAAVRAQLARTVTKGEGRVTLSAEYRQRAQLIGERRVVRAGERMARMLRSILGGFDFEKASKGVPKPREVWPHVAKDRVAREFQVLADEIVTSDTDPRKKLRRVRARFRSIRLGDRTWTHPCVMFLPAAPDRGKSTLR